MSNPPESQSKRVARNVLLTFGTQIISTALALIVTLFLPRIGTTKIGILTMAGAFSGVLGVLVSLGTSKILVREIARDRERLGSLVAAGVVVRLALGLLAMGIGWLAITLFPYDKSSKPLLFLGIVGMPIGQIVDVLTCALTGLEDFARQSAVALADKVLSSVALIALVILHGPLWAIITVGIVSMSVNLFFCFLAVRHHLRHRGAILIGKIDPAQIRFLLLAGLPFLMSDAFGALYGHCDVILFGLILPATVTLDTAGWYGAAQRLGGTGLIIPTLLCSTILPTMVRLHTEDYAKFTQLVQRLFKIMILTAVPIAGLLVFAPRLILQILHYPRAFAPSIPVIIVWGSGIIFWYLSQAAGTVLIACNRQAVFGKVTGVAALVTIPLCALGIRLTYQGMGNGAVGAITSDVLVEAGMVIAYIGYMPSGLVNRALFGVLLRALVAATPLAGLTMLAREPSQSYLVIAGLLLYVPLCFLMGCIDNRDIEMVRDIFRRRSGGN